jgi:hypothetical protein
MVKKVNEGSEYLESHLQYLPTLFVYHSSGIMLPFTVYRHDQFVYFYQNLKPAAH